MWIADRRDLAHANIVQALSNSQCAYTHTNCILEVVTYGLSVTEPFAPGLKNDKSVLGLSCLPFLTYARHFQSCGFDSTS